MTREDFDKAMSAWLDAEEAYASQPDSISCIGLPIEIVKRIAKEAGSARLIMSRDQYEAVMKES